MDTMPQRKKTDLEPNEKVPITTLNVLSAAIALLIAGLGFWVAFLRNGKTIVVADPIVVVSIVVAVVMLFSIKVAEQWERVIVLRFGRFNRMVGPGLFFVIPIVERIPYLVDMRIRATDFSSECTLTRDTVPVNVDAICFWMIWDAKKAILEVQNYFAAIVLSAQTALRDIIGSKELGEMLAHREEIGKKLKELLDGKTNPWGISIQSVEIRDIIIPSALEDAMSKQAQAERERQARIILGTAETEIADKFAQAAEKYMKNPSAMHLRGMNMLYEGLKEKGSMVIVPSSALDMMNLGAIAGLAVTSKEPEKVASRDKTER